MKRTLERELNSMRTCWQQANQFNGHYFDNLYMFVPYTLILDIHEQFASQSEVCMSLLTLIRPVWKHGPRSLVWMRDFGKLNSLVAGNLDRVISYLYVRIAGSVFPQQEHIYWDPKDGELYLCRVKSGEILLEARNDTDVQIVRWI